MSVSLGDLPHTRIHRYIYICHIYICHIYILSLKAARMCGDKSRAWEIHIGKLMCDYYPWGDCWFELRCWEAERLTIKCHLEALESENNFYKFSEQEEEKGVQSWPSRKDKVNTSTWLEAWRSWWRSAKDQE